MREKINILWLEDELSSISHKKRKGLVEKILEEKGYMAGIKEFKDFSAAHDELFSNKRYDFFISDYNLNGDQTGLTYLKEIRNKNGYKQFIILYSNNEYSVIKEDIIKILRETSIDVFSNFTFFSLADKLDRKYFENSIDVILCRWDEPNAIRGRYMCDNAELEYLLRKKLNETDYHNNTYTALIKSFYRNKVHQSNKDRKKDILNNWLNLVNKRNMLAHVDEKYSPKNGYYIESKGEGEKITICEKDLDNERKKLIQLKQDIISFLNNPNN